MTDKKVNCDIQNIREQIGKVKEELNLANTPGQINQLRKRLFKLQLEQLWELDHMEWYVEIDGIGIYDKC